MSLFKPAGPEFAPADIPTLVSVLLPSRGRPQWLKESVRSLWDRAVHPHHLELILKIDEDDTATRQAAEEIAATGVRTILWVSPRGKGYEEIHHWINGMASLSSGQWLLIWNDDARMNSDRWDEMVHFCIADPDFWHGVDEVCVKVPQINGEVGCTAFFFVHRKVYELLGRVSYIPHCDTWVASMMKVIDSIFFMPMMDVTHMEEHKDIIWQEGQPARSTPDYTSRNLDGMRTKLNDALVLLSYMEARKLK